MKVGRWGFALAVAMALWPALPTRALSPELMDAYRQYQALNQQGDYAAAIPFAEKALRLGEGEFGPNRETTALLLNNLAELYHAEGRYGDAAPLFKRALPIMVKTLGPEHPDVARSLENYAATLRKTGRDAEAARLERRAKSMRIKHPEWTHR